MSLLTNTYSYDTSTYTKYIMRTMNSKLTLSLDKIVIQAAKKYAKEHKTSVSRLAEQYFLDLIHSKPRENYPKESLDFIGIAKVQT